MSESREEAERRQIDWALSEIEGRHTPPDLTEKILSWVSSPRSHGLPPTSRRGYWSTLAVAAGLAVIAGVAWIIGSDPDPGRPAVRKLPPAIEVHSLEDVQGLPDDVRNVRGTGLDDAALSELAKRRDLERVDLSTRGATFVTDAGLKELSSLSKLSGLNLGGQREITEKGLQHLEALPILGSISLARTDIKLRALRVVAKSLRSLRSLDLSDNPSLGEAGVVEVAKMYGLTWLSLRNCSGILPRSIIELRTRLRQLRYLDLSHNSSVDDVGLTYLATCNLRELDLSHNPNITIDGIQELPVTLQGLWLTGCDKLTDAVPISIGKRLQQLLHIDLGGCARLTDAGLEELLRARDLQNLDISGTAATEGILTALLVEQNLEELGLDLPWVTPAIERKIRAALPRLRQLRVGQ